MLELCGEGFHINLQGECSSAHYTYLFEHSSDAGLAKDVPALDMTD